MKHIPRIGLVGVSGYARVYLRFLEAAIARGAVRLVAAVVINRNEEQETCDRLAGLGVTLYDNWQGMLEACRGKLDLCLIPIPIHLHEKVAVAAMEAGANVLVEKPLTASVEQVKIIRETERRTGKWVAVGYQDFYSSSTHMIRADLDAGRIGKVKAIRWIGLWPRSHSYYERNRWSGRLTSDGLPVFDSPLNNAMAHFLNLSFYWSGCTPSKPGEPEAAAADLFRCFPIESFDTAVMRVHTDTKVIVQAAVTHCCPSAHPIHMQILGDKGKLNWIHKRDAMWTGEHGKAETFRLETSEEAVEAMFKVVLSRLHNTDARICTTELALPQVACIELLRKFPIHTVSPANLDSGSSGFAIKNIEQDLKSCLRLEALPAELGLKWASHPPVESGSLVPSS